MFLGISSVNLDAKGRLAIPARHRDKLIALSGGKLIVTVEVLEPCLLLYTLPAWEQVQNSLTGLSNVKRSNRQIQRLMLGYASDVDVDGSGRIRIPSELRAYADIQKQVILMGQGKKIEIWDSESWQKRVADWKLHQSDEDFDGDDLAGVSI